MEKLSGVGRGKNLSNQRALPPRALSDQMQTRLSSSLPPQHFIYAPVVGLLTGCPHRTACFLAPEGCLREGAAFRYLWVVNA